MVPGSPGAQPAARERIPPLDPAMDPDPGSRILALVRRRLPQDWHGRYRVEPVLTETFAGIPCFTVPSAEPPDGSMPEQPGNGKT